MKKNLFTYSIFHFPFSIFSQDIHFSQFWMTPVLLNPAQSGAGHDMRAIITCSGKRPGRVAKELTDKGFCSTKTMYYYGAKIHTLCVIHFAPVQLDNFVRTAGKQ